jgi:hypothetical protein
MWEEASDGFYYSDLGLGVEFAMDNNNRVTDGPGP